MPTRVLIAYVLIVLFAAGAVALIWRAIYYSERNVRRRARHARREKYHAQMQEQQSGEPNGSSPDHPEASAAP
jgi:hypothetical protein